MSEHVLHLQKLRNEINEYVVYIVDGHVLTQHDQYLVSEDAKAVSNAIADLQRRLTAIGL